MDVAALVCGGQAVTDELAAVGPACGRTFQARGWEITDRQQRDQARAAGWSVSGPAPMCPRCRRPDPAISRGLA